MDTNEYGLNTKVHDCVFSLSANGVGGEGGVRWRVKIKTTRPVPLPAGAERGKKQPVMLYSSVTVFFQ
jgi:hypothetical protein